MAETNYAGHKERESNSLVVCKMSEASTVETQSNASPARQMLAALTQASKEMTTRFNEVSERASKLNAVLENDVNKSLADLNQQAESMVRVHLDGLTADKDAVLAELTVLRQEEMKVLQNIAKNLRDALTEKLNELLTSLKSDVKEQMSTFQLNIRQKETEVAQTEKNLRKVLRENYHFFLTAFRIRLIQKNATWRICNLATKELWRKNQKF